MRAIYKAFRPSLASFDRLRMTTLFFCNLDLPRQSNHLFCLGLSMHSLKNQFTMKTLRALLLAFVLLVAVGEMQAKAQLPPPPPHPPLPHINLHLRRPPPPPPGPRVVVTRRHHYYHRRRPVVVVHH